jgi:multicomponent Na+:H+ antiporter subunit B
MSAAADRKKNEKRRAGKTRRDSAFGMKHHLILRIITKLLIAPILLFALYVQFHGEISSGGGFQAGVIAAAAIILYGLVFGLEAAERAVPPSFVYGFMVGGVLLFAGVGVSA